MTVPPPPLRSSMLGSALSDPDGHLGEPLLLLGRGPLPIPSVSEAAVAIDEGGRTVLIAHLTELDAGTAEALADELDRLATLNDQDLRELGGTTSLDLEERHKDLFGTTGPPSFNREQRLKVLVDRQPDEAGWKALIIEAGGRLSGVHLGRDGTFENLSPPESLLRSGSTAEMRWSATNWVYLAIVLLGVGIVLVGLWRVLSRDPGSASPDSQPLAQSSRSQVVPSAPFDATATHWIGQRRSVTGLQGRALLAFRSDEGLRIVSDQANQGRSWRSPVGIAGVTPDSFAVASAGGRRLGVAVIDDGSAFLFQLRQSVDGWELENETGLGGPAASAVIDTTWDDRNRLFHVVWAVNDDDRELLQWTAIDTSGIVVDDRGLTSAGEVPILANVGADHQGGVLVTYRRPDAASGWFSQSARRDASTGVFEWSPEESLPTTDGIGASSLAIDTRGVAHLVLRDSTNSELEYHRRSPQRGWAAPAVAAVGDSIDEVDFPSVTIDEGSRLVYVFFQSNESGAPQTRVAVLDPVAGWLGPFSVSDEASPPNSYPTSPRTVSGQPIVFWTTAGGTIEASRFSVP